MCSSNAFNIRVTSRSWVDSRQRCPRAPGVYSIGSHDLVHQFDFPMPCDHCEEGPIAHLQREKPFWKNPINSVSIRPSRSCTKFFRSKSSNRVGSGCKKGINIHGGSARFSSGLDPMAAKSAVGIGIQKVELSLQFVHRVSNSRRPRETLRTVPGKPRRLCKIPHCAQISLSQKWHNSLRVTPSENLRTMSRVPPLNSLPRSRFRSGNYLLGQDAFDRLGDEPLPGCT